LVYANGSTKDQAIKTSNSIVHIKFVTNFWNFNFNGNFNGNFKI
jgi:hypothetical protein